MATLMSAFMCSMSASQTAIFAVACCQRYTEVGTVGLMAGYFVQDIAWYGLDLASMQTLLEPGV